jgi:hypothetical protein
MIPQKSITPVHFSQAFGLAGKEDILDFFDTNLAFDSKLFIDPFLLRKSPVLEEKSLFNRFTELFKYIYTKSLEVNGIRSRYDDLRNLICFPEIREISLGYTERSNAGSGLRDSFTNAIISFFLSNSARRLINEDDLYPGKQFNPVTFEIFTDGVGSDGISDLTANVIIDYLIKYTQKQCKLWEIPQKLLPINRDGFDFENMTWKDGGYYLLPENPLSPGEAVLLVPKRLLRAHEHEKDTGPFKRTLVGFLKENPRLMEQFSNLLSRNIDSITTQEIRGLLLQDEFLFKKLMETLDEKRSNPYDFNKDPLGFLDIRRYHYKLQNLKIDKDLDSCEGLFKHVGKMLDIVNDELSQWDGWKEMWQDTSYIKPQIEAVFGRRVRGIGFGYFEHLPEVVFKPESTTSGGPVDFEVIHKDCRIVIELKKLGNSTLAGQPDPLPAYLHGIRRQLPEYAIREKAKYAFYITGQHFTSSWPRGKKRTHHDNRIGEIKSFIPKITTAIQEKVLNFKEIFYLNIDFSPKKSASKTDKNP